MRELLTPKQVANVLDVSESSVKRWCDKGVIPTQYTAGGHRRIAVSAMLQFVREHNYRLANPEILGLPVVTGRALPVLDRARDQLTQFLLCGDEFGCRRIGLELYLAEHSVSVICDEVLAAALREIGRRWSCAQAEVYQERRSCEIALRMLHELRSLAPAPPVGAPIAIGGAASGDQYCLGTVMAELVLCDGHWNAVSLGDNIPFESFSAAIRHHRPRLFWLSCSHVAHEDEFLRGYRRLFDEYGSEVAFVVGGYALTDDLRRQMKYAAYCDNLQHLESFAQTLRGAIEAPAPART